MYQQILDMLMAKYGHLSYEELTEELRKDGLGEFVDTIQDDPDLMGLISELSKASTDHGVISARDHEVRGTPVEYHGTIHFDPKACLQKCTGNCCKNKNYLMINITDIHCILSSKAANFFEIQSTIDLFDRNPPLVELFYNEEYRFYLPYIRYLPEGADLLTLPEDAKGSICPFLRPIHEVYSYHKKALPQWANKDAMGCILMEDKPAICRLSPLGKCSGMVTGKVTYEYLPPVLDCPACETDIEVKVSEYLSSVVSASEEEQQERFHKMLMKYNDSSKKLDKKRFSEITKQVYNIDKLLLEYGLGLEYRPSVEHLVEIVFAASHGDFSVYERFIEGLSKKNK